MRHSRPVYNKYTRRKKINLSIVHRERNRIGLAFLQYLVKMVVDLKHKLHYIENKPS